MPRVIQPSGGGGKMRVRYTARRKRGIIATSKRIMAEGMTLHAAASELVLPPPPAEKLIQTPLRKTKPPHHPPAISALTPAHID